MRIPTYIVDSFTDEAFKGNPAGVCLAEKELDDHLMLSIAQELNLSETAFLEKTENESLYNIRYFSPKMEIPLCGHATLASARILLEVNPFSIVHFMTAQRTELVVKVEKGVLHMEFPAYGTVSAEAPKKLLGALGLNEIVNCEYNKENRILLLEIKDTSTLRELRPDFEALVRSHDDINGVLVTASSDDAYDFHSRYFWPWSGTNEDPVTGGTHTFLTGYWAERLGKKRMKSFQASHRTGFMEVELLSDTKLKISGNAVIVFEGELHL